MNKQKLRIRVTVLIIFIFFFNWASMSFHWYSLVPWLDMLMHFLGGIWLALASALVLPFPGNTFKFFFRTILVVFLVSILWEVFEFIVKNNIFKEDFDLADTISDLFFDLAGAMLALVYFLKRIMLRKSDTL